MELKYCLPCEQSGGDDSIPELSKNNMYKNMIDKIPSFSWLFGPFLRVSWNGACE